MSKLATVKSNQRKGPMQNITINLPELYNDIIQKFIKFRIVPSRSEAVRMAITEFLIREEQNMSLFHTIVDSQGEHDSPRSKTTSTIKSTQKRENGE